MVCLVARFQRVLDCDYEDGTRLWYCDCEDVGRVLDCEDGACLGFCNYEDGGCFMDWEDGVHIAEGERRRQWSCATGSRWMNINAVVSRG